MTPEKWRFVGGDDGRVLFASGSPFDGKTEIAVLDWLESDVGGSTENVLFYRSLWNRVLSGETETVTGNGTGQTLADGKVVLESLYDQWEDVTLTIGEFEEILDRYTAYLGEKEQG